MNVQVSHANTDPHVLIKLMVTSVAALQDTQTRAVRKVSECFMLSDFFHSIKVFDDQTQTKSLI